MKSTLLTLLLLVVGANSFAQSDEKAILTVIETETRAYHDAKPELEMSMWHLAPYNEHQSPGWVSITGSPFIHGEQFKNYSETGLKQNKPTGITPSLSDIDVQVRGNVAWATLTETHTNGANQLVRKTRQTRILEKKDGQWKHVLVATQHQTPP